MDKTITIKKNEFDVFGGFYKQVILNKISIINKISKKYKINRLELIEKYCPEYKYFDINI